MNLKKNLTYYSRVLKSFDLHNRSDKVVNGTEVIGKLKVLLKNIKTIEEHVSNEDVLFNDFVEKDYSNMRFFRNKRKANITQFYNSISLVILCLLAGGLLVLLLIIIFQSFENNNKFEYALYEY